MNYFHVRVVKKDMSIHEHLSLNFSENAKALACFASKQPIVKGSAVTLAPGIKHPRVKSALLNIDGVTVSGFIKPTSRKVAGLQVLIADLARVLGAATTSCIVVENALDLISPVEVADEPGIGIFSAAPFAQYDTVESRHRILLGADVVSLGGGLQFRALLNDIDPPEINAARCKETDSVCFFDHERSWPDRDGFVHEHNKATIESIWRCSDEATCIDFYKASRDMAGWIYKDGEKIILASANAMVRQGISLPKHFASGLLERTELFERPVIVDYLKREAGLVI